MSENNNSELSRRNVLKASAGIGISSFSAATTAAADSNRTESDTRKHLLQARKIQSNAGIEARVRYLEAHDIRTGYARLAAPRPENSQGFSIQAADGEGQDGYCVDPNQCDGDIDLTLSLSHDMRTGLYFASLAMRYKYSYQNTQSHGYYAYTGPRSPDDAAGITWEKDSWKVKDRQDIPSSTNGDANINWYNGSWDYDGLGYKVDSKGIAKDSGITSIGMYWSDYEFADVELRKGSNYTDGDAIHGTYEYTWNGGSIDSISVGWPWTIGASYGTFTKSRPLQTNLEAKTLSVTEDDIY